MPIVAAPVDWIEVRRASEQGVSDERLEEVYGVNKNAIRQRRYREKWISKTTLEQARLKGLQTQAKNRVLAQAVTSAVTTAPSALAVTTDALLQNGQKGSLIGSNLTLKLLENAEANPLSVKALRDVSDLAAAVKLVRLAAGMDRPEITTNTVITVGGWQANLERSEKNRPVIEQADIEQVMEDCEEQF